MSISNNIKQPSETNKPGVTTSTINLFGFDISNVSKNKAVGYLSEQIEKNSKTTVAFLNADCINKAANNIEYQQCIKSFDTIYADGVGMRWAAKLQGRTIVDNVNGTDLFPLLLKKIGAHSRSIYLLGGRPDRAAKVAKFIRATFPKVKVNGHYHGYFDHNAAEPLINDINRSNPDVLLVAMGAPKQELWIKKNQHKLKAPVVIGVGGLFDYYSGAIPRAPKLFREHSLEWVWRLMMEPRVKAKRYILGNLTFLWRAMTEALRAKKRHNPLKTHSVLTTARVYMWRAVDNFCAWAKRGMDIVIALLAAAFLSPIITLTAIAIRIESSGSCLFSQTRVGKNGKEFTMYKFRSMYSDAEDQRKELDALNEMTNGVTFKLRDDPRITHVGRVIRKLSIDELPQLWNVIVGNMSLVGPRPPLPTETSQYSTADRYRLQCKPGITCYWQVLGRSTIPFKQQVQLDVKYIIEKSIWTDIKILVQTIPAVLFSRGAI